MNFAEATQSGQTTPGSVSESGQLQKGQLRGQTLTGRQQRVERPTQGRGAGDSLLA